MFVAAIATVAPHVAHAQPKPAPVDPAKAKTAKQYVDAGLAAQNTKDYDTAISLYQKAYDLVPHPVLLFNIGQAHRLAGHDPEAKSFYERYLQADPTGPQASIAKDFIREIDSKVADTERKAQADKAAADAAKADQSKKADQAKQVTKRSASKTRPPKPSASESSKSSMPLRKRIATLRTHAPRVVGRYASQGSPVPARAS